MSFGETIYSSIISPVVDFATDAVSMARNAVGEALGIVEDTSVTDALAGEADTENAGLDTFNSSAEAAQSAGEEADEKVEAGEEKKTGAEETISGAEQTISETETSITALQEQLSMYEGLQDTATEEGVDYSGEISGLQTQIAAQEQTKAAAEQEKAEGEAELAEAETEIEEAETQGAQAESDADGAASQGQATGNEAEGTEQEAESAVTEAEAEAVSEENNTQGEAAPAAEAETAAPAAETTAPAQAPAAATSAPATTPTATPAVETPAATVVAGNGNMTDVQTRIENNETTDAEMADVILGDMFEEDFMTISADDIIGLNAMDAVEVASEAFKTNLYSSAVYSNKVSTSTDTATVEENQEAVSDFMAAYSDATDEISAPGVEFLSLTDKSDYEAVSAIQARLNGGEYIMTKKVEDSTTTAENIQVSTTETADKEAETGKTRGEDLLRRLSAVISDDAEAPEDLDDDILTQKEYDDIENFFNGTDDYASAYEQIVLDAQKYGIYEEANLSTAA